MSNAPAAASRRVLITGAGAGIGAATARHLVSKGWRVAIFDRDGAAARRMAEEIGAIRLTSNTWRQ